MNIEIPSLAKELLVQVYFLELRFLERIKIKNHSIYNKEKKYKLYKSNLEMLLIEFNRIVEMIPIHLIDLFEPHIRQALELCNQGCNILTWSSLNIG